MQLLHLHSTASIHFLLSLTDKRLVLVVSHVHPTLRTAAELRADLEKRLVAGHEYVAFDCATPSATGECPGHESFTVVPVKPLAMRQSAAFVDGHDADGNPWGEVRAIEVPVLPPSPWGTRFREAREARTGKSAGQEHVTIGDASRRLGVTLVQVSELERGRAVLESDEEWDRAIAMLRPFGEVRR